MKEQWFIYAYKHFDKQYVDQFDNKFQALRCLMEYRLIYGKDWELKLELKKC